MFSLGSIASLIVNTGDFLVYEADHSRKQNGAFILEIMVRACMCLKQKVCLN